MPTHSLTAGEFCTRIVSVAYPELLIDEAARVMREHDVGSLVVVDEVEPEDRRVVGMLTDRDIVVGVVAAQKDSQTVSVADVMSRNVAVAHEEESVLDVLSTMQREGVRRLPVVGPNNRLIGIVTIDDLLEAAADEMKAMAGVIRAKRRSAA